MRILVPASLNSKRARWAVEKLPTLSELTDAMAGFVTFAAAAATSTPSRDSGREASAEIVRLRQLLGSRRPPPILTVYAIQRVLRKSVIRNGKAPGRSKMGSSRERRTHSGSEVPNRRREEGSFAYIRSTSVSTSLFLVSSSPDLSIIVR